MTTLLAIKATAQSVEATGLQAALAAPNTTILKAEGQQNSACTTSQNLRPAAGPVSVHGG